MGSTTVGTRFIQKYYTWLKVQGTDKHTSLTPFWINYDRKQFYDTAPRVKYGSTTFNTITLRIMTSSITTLSIMTFSIMTFSIMTLSMMTLSIMTLNALC
jgi:hypothetical protein